MCGITGILNLDCAPASPVLVERMSDVLAHRGPDGRGVWTKGPIGLGHRRLAILDLSEAAAQPMQRNHLTITYNGEIYNFQELRSELEKTGHRFSTRSDTEVILAAYAEWGPSCVQRFNGMFALAIWDNQKQELFLARDRYGIKPLYYAFFDTIFLFGSEQKAILAHPAARREIDLEALLEYFTFQNIFTDRTLTKGIKLFPPGTHLVLNPRALPDSSSSSSLLPLAPCPFPLTPNACPFPLAPSRLPLPLAPSRFTQYWDFDFREPQSPRAPEEYLEELGRLFTQAVHRQMVSDVELGTYLSGGIDSGSITAIAARQKPFIKSFTCGFDLRSASGLEMACDERANAEFMSYLFKTEHYEMVLKAGDMERCLPRLTWHLEEPRVGQSYPNYYAAKLASKFVKVVLGGTGGDELFGGYPWRYYRAAVCTDFEDYIDKYYLFWQRLISNSRIKEVFAPIWKDVQHVWTRDIFRDVFGERRHLPCTPEQSVNNSLYFEAKTFLHGLLVVEDKLAMAHGLEGRVPFLDNDLVDFAMRLPVSMKLANLTEVVRLNENEPGPKAKKYYQKTRDGKMALRQVLGRYVPPEVSNGIKQGFSAPDGSWFKGDSIKFVADRLIKRDAAIYEYLDKTAVTNLIMDHLEGRQNRRLLIWSLLNVEEILSPNTSNEP